MPKIFISYRRQDSHAAVGRIYDRLSAKFGPDAVFRDIDSIDGGVNFPALLDKALRQSRVFLAVIGPKWAGVTKAGRRIDDPGDFVRLEVEAALRRKVAIIPVLLDRVPMPTAADLPESLAPLANLQAVEVDMGRDFDHHVGRLIHFIARFERLRRALRRVAVFLTLLIVLLGIVGIASSLVSHSIGLPSVSLLGRKTFTNSIGMTFVRIEPGEFLMGSPMSDKEAAYSEMPQHKVRLTKPFWLGQFEVTHGQYRAIMPVTTKTSKQQVADDLPVEMVSWIDATAFCKSLTDREKSQTEFSGRFSEDISYRLPTEAEWEYACRAGATTIFPFGDDPAKLGDHAWYSANSNLKTHPVGKKEPNAWKLYDMLGNRCEWCSDYYDDRYYEKSPPTDPPGGGTPPMRNRVIRGGHQGSQAKDCRPAARQGQMANDRQTAGFRVALTIPD